MPLAFVAVIHLLTHRITHKVTGRSQTLQKYSKKHQHSPASYAEAQANRAGVRPRDMTRRYTPDPEHTSWCPCVMPRGIPQRHRCAPVPGTGHSNRAHWGPWMLAVRLGPAAQGWRMVHPCPFPCSPCSLLPKPGLTPHCVRPIPCPMVGPQEQPLPFRPCLVPSGGHIWITMER